MTMSNGKVCLQVGDIGKISGMISNDNIIIDIYIYSQYHITINKQSNHDYKFALVNNRVINDYLKIK